MAGIERAAVDKGQLNGKTIVWVMGNLKNLDWYNVLLYGNRFSRSVNLIKGNIFELGGPGSGRGTQCEKVCLKHGDFVHISSGDLMKAEVMSGSARGAKLYQLMSSGEAVPNEIVTDILAEAMIRKAGGSKV